MRRAAAFIFTLTAFAACASAARCEDRIVAVVNKEVITQKDLESFTTFTRLQLSQKLSGKELEDKLAAMKADLLQRLIEDRLIIQEAKKNSVKVDEGRVKSKMAEVKKRYETERQFSDALVEQGLSESDIETRIRDQMMMYALIDTQIREKIQVRPQEITEYYNQNKAQLALPERRAVVSLAAPDEGGAKELSSRLRQGVDIDALAKEKGLKVNSFTCQKGELKKEVDDAVFHLDAKQVSEPVNVNGAFYVFMVKEVLPSQEEALTDVQDSIAQVLFEKKMQEGVAAWLDGIKKKSYIKILNG